MIKKFLLTCLLLLLNFFYGVQAAELLKINNISFDNSDNIIFISTSANAEYQEPIKLEKLSDRVYFDINNAVLTRPNSSWTFKNSVIKQIKLSQFSTDPHVVRAVIVYNKGFNPSKLKLYKVNGNFILNYKNTQKQQDYLYSVYKDDTTKSDAYYEYTTFTEDSKDGAPESNFIRSNEAMSDIQKAFTDKTTASIMQKLSDNREPKLKTRYYVSSIDIKRGNALIRGVGQIAIENPLVLTNPTRLVFDMPNTYVAQSIRNKEFKLSDKETIKIGQFEPTKARIVILSDDIQKFRPIYSFDGQSIFLAHDNRILGVRLFDKTASTTSYSATRLNDTTDVLNLTFSNPVIHSILKNDDKIEINLYNSSGFNHQAFEKNLKSEYFEKLKTDVIIPYGIKIVLPAKKNTTVNYKESIDCKQLELTVINPKTSIIQALSPVPVINKNDNIKTIVVDPGHGGSDVGAMRENIYEKNITLDISKRVADILTKKGYNVEMTRRTDIFVSLKDRVVFTEAKKADLFVSIHVNSSVKPEITGLETHYYTDCSYPFAQAVHKQFVSAVNSKDRGIFKSKFYVINNNIAPSILVETGFISNDEERKSLLSEERKQKTAEAIADGVIRFINKK